MIYMAGEDKALFLGLHHADMEHWLHLHRCGKL